LTVFSLFYGLKSDIYNIYVYGPLLTSKKFLDDTCSYSLRTFTRIQ